MALAGTNIIEVRTTGDDTNFSGMFDPGQTAGMNTDGAATSATGNSPVFTSASYNFVAGDVGAWLFIASGTNWNKGWYQIASVAANAATLTATSGSALQFVNGNAIPTTVAGCATTASPTAATWSIDYSQQDTSQFTYTDITCAGAGLTASSAGNPFGKQQIGNGIVLTSGTNITAGRYTLASVSGTTGTFIGAANMSTGATSNGAGRMGGALASPGKAGSFKVASNKINIKSGTYNVTSASANVAAGLFSDSTGGTAAAPSLWQGYGSLRGDGGTKPTIKMTGSQTGVNLAATGGSWVTLDNLLLDANSKATSSCHNNTGARNRVTNVTGQNAPATAFVTSGSSECYYYKVVATANGGASGAGFLPNGTLDTFFYCEAYANTGHGFAPTSDSIFVGCVSSGNTGASTDGYICTGHQNIFISCVAYGNGRHGFNVGNGGNGTSTNCIAEANSGYGWTATAGVNGTFDLLNCCSYNNTSGAVNTTQLVSQNNLTTAGSGTFFTNAASGDFSLNNTASQGALARGTGYPGTLPRGTTVGHIDIGVAQHAAAAPGGLIVPAGMNGGIRG